MSKRIYIAGLFSTNCLGLQANTLETLENMRVGMRVGVELLLKGYAPFVPWFDYHFALMLRDNEKLTKKHFYDYSISWLKVSDAVLIISNSETSMVNNEIEIAFQNKIPVVYSVEELDRIFNE